MAGNAKESSAGLTWRSAALKIRGSAGIAQLVEHDLAKVGVASSSLVSRSSCTRNPDASGFCFMRRAKRGAASLASRVVRAKLAIAHRHRPGGRVVMQRPAKPRTPVQFRPWPPFCSATRDILPRSRVAAQDVVLLALASRCALRAGASIAGVRASRQVARRGAGRGPAWSRVALSRTLRFALASRYAPASRNEATLARARVAKLVDAGDLKSPGRKVTWVRAPPRAPTMNGAARRLTAQGVAI